MRIKVLGSAAGGGFPQWNCGCPNCAGLRAGTLRAKARTQESVAVSADGENWFLLGASPEIRSQIEDNPILHPRSRRHSPIAGILLNNGDLDRCLGLLSLRESYPFAVYATDAVRSGFTEGNVLYNTLSRFDGQVKWVVLQPGVSCDLLTREGKPSGLTVTAVPAPGKRPLHLGHLPPGDEDNVGFLISSPTRTLAYFASTGGITPAMKQAISRADALIMDGTFWAETELIDLGIGTRAAADMSHIPISGPAGSLKAFNGSGPLRRIYIHINNTNPILNEDSPEAALVREAGWQVAYDGMEFAL